MPAHCDNQSLLCETTGTAGRSTFAYLQRDVDGSEDSFAQRTRQVSPAKLSPQTGHCVSDLNKVAMIAPRDRKACRQVVLKKHHTQHCRYVHDTLFKIELISLLATALLLNCILPLDVGAIFLSFFPLSLIVLLSFVHKIHFS